MNFPMPPGLDLSEQLAYRTSYSRIFGAYIQEHGTPSMPGKDKAALRDHAARWHAEHDAPRMAKSHLGGGPRCAALLEAPGHHRTRAPGQQAGGRPQGGTADDHLRALRPADGGGLR